MNSRRIFFFDWDGTLSIGNRPVSHADRCALKELQKQGHRLFLCTGRARGYLLPEALEFEMCIRDSIKRVRNSSLVE